MPSTNKELAHEMGRRIAAVRKSRGLTQEELAEAKGAIQKLGLKLEAVHAFPIDGAEHSVIVLRKVSPTPPRYPRRYAKIKQSPL